VDLDEHGRARVSHVVRGDRTEEVLSYVEYFEQDVLTRIRRHIERSLEEGRMTFEESALLQRRYEAGLASYTYLTRDRDDAELFAQDHGGNGHGSTPPQGDSPAHPPHSTGPVGPAPAPSVPPATPAARSAGSTAHGAVRRP